MKKIKKVTLDKIYGHYLNSSGVSTDLKNVKNNNIFFAVNQYKPKFGFKYLIWKSYSNIELFYPEFLKKILLFLKNIKIDKIFKIDIEGLLNNKINCNYKAPIAIECGARVSIVDTKKYKGNEFIYVPCVNSAYEGLATYHKNSIDVLSIGITGSCGKTTTKELVSSVLSKEFKVHKTSGSHNTIIGVSTTILSADKDTDFVVVEISSSGEGVIKQKCEIVQPSLGLITCIGKAHLEGFGDLEGVIQVKRQLFDYLAEHQGFFFANIDDPYVAEIVGDYGSVWTYGQNPAALIHGEVVSSAPFLKVRWHLPEDLQSEAGAAFLDIQTQLFGTYNISNVLAAIAIGAYVGVSPENIRMGIESFTPEEHRSQIISRGDITLIMDAYNANPTSMNAALNDFASLQASRKIIILGDMLELGQHSAKEHEDIVSKIAAMKFDAVYLVGREFSKADTAQIGRHFSSPAQLCQALEPDELMHAHVLVKGSRGIGLEAVLEKFDSVQKRGNT